MDRTCSPDRQRRTGERESDERSLEESACELAALRYGGLVSILAVVRLVWIAGEYYRSSTLRTESSAQALEDGRAQLDW